MYPMLLSGSWRRTVSKRHRKIFGERAIKEEVSMKNKIIIFFVLCCFVLGAVLLFMNKEETIENKSVNLPTDTYSGTPEDKQEEEKIVYVTDETGEKRELKLSDINTKDAGVYFPYMEWLTDFSQVSDGHYYYLRFNNDSDSYGFTIYRDEGERIGDFDVPYDEAGDPYRVLGFVKYGDRFYAFLDHFEYRMEIMDAPQELAYIDLEQSKPIVICDVTDDHMLNDGNTVFCNIYGDSFYFDSRSRWQRGDRRPGTSIRYDFTGEHVREELSVPLNMTKAKPYLTYMDGKVYYGISSDKTVTIYSYDMVSKTEKQVLVYTRKKKYGSECVFISIDENYIYCEDYMIPRAGGKMLPVLKNAKKNKYGIADYSFNEKYIFYIDEKEKAHRINKKTKKDIIISKKKVVGIDCTEDKIYIRVRDKKWYSLKEPYDPDDSWEIYDVYADDLYCMDLNGKKEKRIW